jgi:glyoxylase-like metal-dependent hydrolase (beta-lactamase superfamily II)/dienelactone hydrolase
MRLLRPGLWALESSSLWGCNSYLVATAGRVLLVDPGPSFQLNPVARELRAAGRSPYDVSDILLTHYDWDHSHSAAEWRRRTGATVWLGAADAEILRTRRVPGTRLRRFACRLFRLSELPEGTVELRGEVSVAPGLTALPTPGHTPGHYAYVRGDVALIGDAADTQPDGELRPSSSPGLMTNLEQADATRALLSAMPVHMFGPGHTPAVERQVLGEPTVETFAMRARRDRQAGTAQRTGTSANGMEFATLGSGSKSLLFIGGGPGGQIPTGVLGRLMSAQYTPFVRAGYTVWLVCRRRHMPPGHTVADMADDYAQFIEEQLGGHIDLVVGESYGGMIAQYLAANHPGLVGRVVLALSAATITDWGRDADLRWATARAEGRHDDAGAIFLEYLIPGANRAALRRRFGALAGRMFRDSPVPAGDLLVEARAEVAFDARDVLPRIPAPVLILCGDKDEFFSRKIVEETAALITDCTVVWYEGKGHMGAAMSGLIPKDVLKWAGAMQPQPIV